MDNVCKQTDLKIFEIGSVADFIGLQNIRKHRVKTLFSKHTNIKFRIHQCYQKNRGFKCKKFESGLLVSEQILSA